jgi:hypothetical protein
MRKIGFAHSREQTRCGGINLQRQHARIRLGSGFLHAVLLRCSTLGAHVQV